MRSRRTDDLRNDQHKYRLMAKLLRTVLIGVNEEGNPKRAAFFYASSPNDTDYFGLVKGKFNPTTDDSESMNPLSWSKSKSTGRFAMVAPYSTSSICLIDTDQCLHGYCDQYRSMYRSSLVFLHNMEFPDEMSVSTNPCCINQAY